MQTIFFATNRDVSGPDENVFGPLFNAKGAQQFRVGSAEVEKVSDDPDDGYRVDHIVTEHEQPATATEEEKRGSDVVMHSMQTNMAQDRSDALVYIHGFGNSFDNALRRAAQLQTVYTFRRPSPRGGTREIMPETFVFSWPSDGRMIPVWSYESDRQDATLSGEAMAKALARLIDFVEIRSKQDRCNQRIHLVAHSMGNWALRHALQGLRRLQSFDRAPKIFDNVFLMAADEDADALEREDKLGLLPQISRQVHVYYSKDDGALWLSKRTKLNGDRLGAIGPSKLSTLPFNIVAIDCVSVDNTDGLSEKLLPDHVNHQYYRLRPEVIADVRAVLAGTRPELIENRELIEPRRFRIVTKPMTGSRRPRTRANV